MFQNIVKIIITVLLFVCISTAYADLQDALSAYENQNYQSAYDQFMSLAEIGNADAFNNLGVMYFKGQHVEKNYQQAQECPITIFMEQIGGKWKPVIIWLLLLNEVMRFNELDKSLAGISQKMLSQQLKALERLQIVSRKAYPVIPPKVEYRLTEKGLSLKPLLTDMMQWSNQHLK